MRRDRLATGVRADLLRRVAGQCLQRRRGRRRRSASWISPASSSSASSSLVSPSATHPVDGCQYGDQRTRMRYVPGCVELRDEALRPEPDDGRRRRTGDRAASRAAPRRSGRAAYAATGSSPRAAGADQRRLVPRAVVDRRVREDDVPHAHAPQPRVDRSRRRASSRTAPRSAGSRSGGTSRGRSGCPHPGSTPPASARRCRRPRRGTTGSRCVVQVRDRRLPVRARCLRVRCSRAPASSRSASTFQTAASTTPGTTSHSGRQPRSATAISASGSADVAEPLDVRADRRRHEVRDEQHARGRSRRGRTAAAPAGCRGVTTRPSAQKSSDGASCRSP